MSERNLQAAVTIERISDHDLKWWKKIKGLTYVPRQKKYFEDRLNVGFMETEQITVPRHSGRRRYKTKAP